ncbi:MAG: ribosome-associated translation inhibitor RaiA [Spirochaetes bacterium]|nr:ribosome-associated translation inhibitor RaiA [Spirochaetota bacterium]
MNLIIQGSSNFTVSEKMKSYIKKRIEKLNYFKNHIMEINFHLDAEKYIYKVDVTLSLKKLGIQKFEVTDREMYNAIDKIVHKMDVKINREKGKIQSHSKPGVEDFVEFFNQLEENNPEPTEYIVMNKKPTALQDAYLLMKQNQNDYFGFNLMNDNEEAAPAFLRKLDDNVVYLIKKSGDSNYKEYLLMTDDNNISIGNEVRNITLSSMSLVDAQKDILSQDEHSDVFVETTNNRISFLFKEGNGRWKLIH